MNLLLPVSLYSQNNIKIKSLQLDYSDIRIHSLGSVSRMAFVLFFHNPLHCHLYYMSMSDLQATLGTLTFLELNSKTLTFLHFL